MILLGEVDLDDLRRHEEATNANVRLGGYGMDRHCPVDQMRCFRVQLEAQDEVRLFLLGLKEFVTQTRWRSCRVRDVLPGISSIPRVASFIADGVDLRARGGLELVLVAADLEAAPLVAIDGNHRSIAQFLLHGTMDGVPAFVGIHPAIGRWRYLPWLARTRDRDD